MKLNIYQMYELCCGLWRAMKMNTKPTIFVSSSSSFTVASFQDMHEAMSLYTAEVCNHSNPTLYIEDIQYHP